MLGAAALLLGGLGLLVTPECLRDLRRYSRLDRDGLRLQAEILHVEEHTESTSSDDREQSPTTVEDATIRYVVNDRAYEGRRRLPGPIHHLKPGDRLPIMVLPDEPERSYGMDTITGNWIMSVMMPLILLGGAATFGAIAWHTRA
jgi:hypothetical protein